MAATESAQDDQLERALEELYAGPLASFVARRKEGVKKLREAGARAHAQRLAKARKPTALAWALNQVAHHDAKALSRFFHASAALQRAHTEALTSKSNGHSRSSSLRSAQKAQRAAMEDVIARAVRVLEGSEGNVTSTTERKLRDTLHAAAFGPDEGRTQLERGLLVKELEGASGLGAFGALPFEMPASAPTPPPEAPSSVNDDVERALKEDIVVEEEREAGAKQRQRKERERRGAERQREEQRRAAEVRAEQKASARQRYDDARREHDEAARALADAEHDAGELERRATEALREAEGARSRAEALRARVEAASEQVAATKERWRSL